MTTPSPCTKVCEMDQASGFCLGCRRTIAEIMRWPQGSAEWKRKVVAALPGRVIRTD